MPEGYGSQRDYMSRISEDVRERESVVEKALRLAFSSVIESRTTEYIVFSKLSALELASTISANPTVLKPLLLLCNVAARAIERDLQIKNLDTYKPRLTEQESAAIAGYIRSFLPQYVAVDALTTLDRTAFIDKEIRKTKGSWEKEILKALNKNSSRKFKKRIFSAEGEKFEIDAACPRSGDIEMAVDVKRIEARRDIHKRCDEIVNKANKLKSVYPHSRFSAVIYYPFIDEHTNIQNRLSTPNIDAVIFASEANESVDNAVKMLLAKLEIRK